MQFFPNIIYVLRYLTISNIRIYNLNIFFARSLVDNMFAASGTGDSFISPAGVASLTLRKVFTS